MITVGVIILNLAGFPAIAADKDVVEIREAMDATVRDLPQGKRAWPDYLREFGFRYDKNPSYGKMADVVSNRFGSVAVRFSDIATNDIQRLMLLSCGWAYDERYYIDYYHLVADLAIKGDITAKDLRWYAVGHRSNKFLDLVARRYGEPRVAQLVDKICQVSPDAKNIDAFRNGTAKRALSQYNGQAVPVLDGKYTTAIFWVVVVVVLCLVCVWIVRKGGCR